MSVLEQLGCSVASIPTLSLLWHVEQSVGAYLSAFMATHGLATFQDFEAELVGSLHSSCTPSLGTDGRTPPAAEKVSPPSWLDR